MEALTEAGLVTRLTAVAKIITVEPAIFLQTFCWGLQSVISQDLMIAKICRDFGYNQTVCGDINNHTMSENVVQEEVTKLNMKLSMLTALPSIVLGLFVGAWSDRNGRKPVMLTPMVGYLISIGVWIANIYYWESPANYLLATGVYIFFGGFTCLLLGLYSYLADITSVTTRTARIGLLDVFLFAGVPVGIFTSAYIYKYSGYYGIFVTSFVLQVFSFLYIALFISDTRGPSSQYCYPETELQSQPRSTVRRYLSIFDWHQLKEVMKTTMKRRQYSLRRVILLLIFLMLLNVTIFSESSIMYLYARKQFSWDEQQFTKFTTCVILVSGVSLFLAMPLLSLYWKVHDATIGVLATLSKITSLVIISIAPNGWVLFLGACCGFLSSLAAIVIRSMLSKVVSKAELGKVFSLLASLEAAVPLFAAPLFTTVYNNTLSTFPGAVFLVQASLFVVSCAIFGYLYTLLAASNRDFSMLVEEEEEGQEDFAESVQHEENQPAVPT